MNFPPSLNDGVRTDWSRNDLPQPDGNTVTSTTGNSGTTGITDAPRTLSLERPSGDNDPSNRLPPSASWLPEPLREVPESALAPERASLALDCARMVEKAAQQALTVLATKINHQLNIACEPGATPFFEPKDPGSLSNMLRLISADKHDLFGRVRSCIRDAMQGNMNFERAPLLREMCPPCDPAVLQTVFARASAGAQTTPQDRSALLDQLRIYAQHLRDSLFQGLDNGNTSKVFPNLHRLPNDVLQELHSQREQFRTLEQHYTSALAMANQAQSQRKEAEILVAHYNAKSLRVATVDHKE